SPRATDDRTALSSGVDGAAGGVCGRVSALLPGPLALPGSAARLRPAGAAAPAVRRARRSARRRGGRLPLVAGGRAAAVLPGRVQLPSRRGHLRPRAAGEPSAPAVAALRDVPRHPTADLRVEVSTRPGADSGPGAGARRPHVRRLAEHGPVLRR